MSGDGDVLWLRRDVTIENDRAWQGCGQQIVAWVDSKQGSNSHDLTK